MSGFSPAFSTVYELLVEVSGAAMAVYFASFRAPEQLDLNVGDWEEVRLHSPCAHVASRALFGIPVQTWSGLRHGEFRLRLDGEVVVDSADLA